MGDVDAAELAWHRRWMGMLAAELDELDDNGRRHENTYEAAIRCVRNYKELLQQVERGGGEER